MRYKYRHEVYIAIIFFFCQTQTVAAPESAVATTSVGYPQVGTQQILMMDPNQVPNGPGSNSLALVPSNMSSTVVAKVILIYLLHIFI